jgi:hypothetical protein
MTGPPLLNTGQLNIITYLFIFLLPIIIISLLMRSVLPKNPMSLRFLKTTIFRGTPWAFREHQGPIWCRRRKVKTKVKNRNPETTATTRHWLRAHLFAFTMASLKVGCQVESSLRCLRQSHRFHIHAIAGIQGDLMSGQVIFDSDSFPICIDIHTSTNTPIFHMASSSSTYRSFAATFETMEAPFFQRETTLQLPGPRFPRENVIPEEFVAKEDLHQGEKNQSTQQTRKTTLIAFQTYLPPQLRRTHPTSPSAEGPSPSI